MLTSQLEDETGATRPAYEIDLARLEQAIEGAPPNIVEAHDAVVIWEAKTYYAMDMAAAKRMLTPYLKGACAVDDLAFASMWHVVEEHPNMFIRTAVQIRAASHNDESQRQWQMADAAARESDFIAKWKKARSVQQEILLRTSVELLQRASEIDAESFAKPHTLSEWASRLSRRNKWRREDIEE